MSHLIYLNVIAIILILCLAKFLKKKRAKEEVTVETVKQELPEFEVEKKFIDEKVIDNYTFSIIVSSVYTFIFLGLFASSFGGFFERAKELTITPLKYVVYFVEIVIGIFFIKTIYSIIREIMLRNKIMNHEYTFVIDTVLDKKNPFFDSEKYYLIFEKVGKVKVLKSVYDETNINDTFYILKVGNDKQLFNTNKYELREDDRVRLEN